MTRPRSRIACQLWITNGHDTRRSRMQSLRSRTVAETAVERELVLRLASVLWRLRRATGIETAIFESVTAEPGKVEHGSSRPTLVEAADLSNRNQLRLVGTRQSDAAAGNELGCDTKKDIATASCAWPLCRLSPLTA